MKANNNIVTAHVAVLSANVIFGITYSMVKLLVPEYMTSFAVNVLRLAVSVPLLWMLFLLKPGKAGVERQDIPRFIACALSGVAINQLLFIKGLSLTSTVHASLLALGTPIFITAAAAVLLRQRFTMRKALGLLLGLGGATILVLAATQAKGNSAMWFGDMLVLINSISYALYFVWVQPLMRKYSPIHVLRWVFTIGFFMVLPFGLTDTLRIHPAAFMPTVLIALGFVTVGSTFLAYLFNMYGLKFLGASKTGSYIYTQPLFAALIGALWLHERIGLSQVGAALLIVSGVALVNASADKKEEEK